MSLLRRQVRGPRVELVCVGTELLTGKQNTHGTYFSNLLEGMGLPLARETTVSDDPQEMESLFREVWRRADLVITTGGLGPTFDDVTREVWARVCRRRLVFCRDVPVAVEARRFPRVTGPSLRRREAWVLSGARVLENRNGAAPGQRFSVGRKTLILLPGPGGELKPMVEESVVPFLRERFSPELRVTRVWRLWGVPESVVDQKIRPWMTAKGGLSWGILAQEGGVDVKMTVLRAGEQRGERILRRWDRRMSRLFGSCLFGTDGQTLPEVVGKRLREAKKTVAVAESCTGGGLAQIITSVPGSSDYFWGGVVSYANRAKINVLGVPAKTIRAEGAVSEAVARAMAEGMRRKAGTDYALSLTGIAGPEGGTPDKPVGLVYLGLATRVRTQVWKKNFLGDRDHLRRQAVGEALNLFRLELEGSGGIFL